MNEGIPRCPSGPRDAANFVLSTDDLPERDRVGYWREVIGRTILRMEVSPLPDKPLQVDLAGRIQLPGLVILRGANAGLRLERTPELLADGNDDLHLPLTVSGVSVAHLRGREVAVGEGDTILVTAADRGTVLHRIRFGTRASACNAGPWHPRPRLRRPSCAPFRATTPRYNC